MRRDTIGRYGVGAKMVALNFAGLPVEGTLRAHLGYGVVVAGELVYQGLWAVLEGHEPAGEVPEEVLMSILGWRRMRAVRSGC